MNKLKLGSLFDGIGGFPLSAQRHGIEPVWASEIEPFPIKVTQHHFPNMKHLGDITKINGAEIEPVDIITFGSPCQGLSLAGKREGLQDERSGLFTEAVRIIREMRAASSNNYPRFAVWENVPGAFSSNKGQDFRAVLEEIAETEIPMPGSGKWATAGMVRTERIDIAWRTLDAQYWGVAQRRKRIFLVADFGGQSAGEILFIEEGLRGHFAESRKAWEEITGNTGDGIKGASGNLAYSFDSLASNSMKSKNPHSGGRFVEISKTLDSTTPEPSKNQGGIAILQAREEVAATVGNGIETAIPINTQIATRHNKLGRGTGFGIGEDGDPSFTLQEAHSHAVCCKYVATASYWDGGQISDCLDCSMLAKGQMMPEKRRFPVVIEPRSQDGVCRIHDDGIVPTLNTAQGGQRQPCVITSQPIPIHDKATRYKGGGPTRKNDGAANGFGVGKPGDVMPTLGTGDRHAVAYTPSSYGAYEEGCGTLRANGGDLGGGSESFVASYAVRRLTPLECERLMGFPDGWTDIPSASDTARYKSLGNSVARPCVDFVMSRITEVLRTK